MLFERRGIEKGLVAGVLILLVIVVGVGFYLSTSVLSQSTTTTSAPPTTSSGTTSTSSIASVSTVTSGTVTSTTTYGLVITNMYADVIGPNLQAPYQNDSSVGDNSFFRGTPGQTISVVFDAIYQLCSGSCPTQITGVVAVQQGFSVIEPTNPPMPVTCNATTGVNFECIFTVTVQTPSTPYNGPLTLVAEG